MTQDCSSWSKSKKRLGMDFNPTEYQASGHSVDMWNERELEVDKNAHREQSAKDLVNKVSEGTIVLDCGQHRYIRNGHLFFPCIKLKYAVGTVRYRVKTVMFWDMVSYRFQRIVDLHN